MRLRARDARFALALALLAPAAAWAEPPRAEPPAEPAAEAAIRLPDRLTAGASSQFMGVPFPDGRRVAYVTDERSTLEIRVQDLDGGAPRALFDRDADATWPRPSPDGRHLLYLTDRDDSTGDACVLDLAGGEHRCLTGPATADVQALWFPGGDVGVVQRDGLHGDFRLVRLPAGGGPATVLVSRTLSTPAAHPAGRTVAYIPVDRGQTEVGVTFAPRTGQGLAFQALGGGAPESWRPELPGSSGFPAYSPDGRWLYFTQYRNDTNGDGTIDGNDHGVVFRVPCDADRGVPPAGAIPRQLTSAAWNCQYPAPGRDRLVVTCTTSGSLDVYLLPADGAVPPDWDPARLDAAAREARDPWERLLLMERALELETDGPRRLSRVRSLAFAEAEAGDLASADHHARALAGPGGSPGESEALRLLIEARLESQRFQRGAVTAVRFAADARLRAQVLAGVAADQPGAAPLALLARSEVLDDGGDEAGAREAFAAVAPASLADPDLLRLWARRAEALRRAAADRPGLLADLALLATHPGLDARDRLGFAHRFATLLLQGVPESRRGAVLAGALAAAPPGSDLAFRLDLEARLSRLGRDDPDAVRKALFELHRSTKDPDRRATLALAATRRAGAAGQDYVTYQAVNTWASGVPRGTPGRPRAESLYRAVVLDRAWGDLAEGSVPEARGRFWEAILQTDAPEAHAGFVEARLAEGTDDLEALWAKWRAGRADDPPLAFARAYRVARDLPALRDPVAAEARALEAEAQVRRSARGLPNAWEVHLLLGFLHHRRFLATGSSVAAQDASAAYDLALDLARRSPRGKAAILLQAGLLQAALGNVPAALRLLDKRSDLPFPSEQARLACDLARARCLFLADRDAEASDLSARLAERVEATPALADARPLVLDRALLHAYAAGRPALAASLAARLRPFVEAGPATDAGRLQRARLDLLEGASLLADGRPGPAAGRLRASREALEALRALPAPGAPWPGRTPPDRPVDRLDLLLAAGALEARALESDGRPVEAAALLDRVAALRRQRLADRDLDEDLLALADAELRRSEAAWRAGDPALFAARARAALAAAWQFGQRTGTPVPVPEARALALLAEARLLHDLPADRAGADLGPALHRARAHLSAHRTPARDADRLRLSALESLWRLRLGDPAQAGPDRPPTRGGAP